MRQELGGVAYDLDGTLYPNYRLNRLLIPFALREWPFLLAFGKARNMIRAAREQDPAGELPDFYEAQARLVAGMLKADPARVKEKAETAVYRGWEPYFKNIKLFSGVKETLAAVREAGLKQGLLSDFPPERKLEYLGLSG
jgi:putative hydrolase of the HAD superfamily